MANEMLPPEYQSEIDTLMKKQRLAQLLQQQSLGFQGAPSTGRIASRTSPLAWLSNALTGYLGTQSDAKAAEGISGVKKRYSEDANSAVEQFLQTPEEAQQGFAAKSPFPQVQGIAKALADRKAKRLEAFGKVAGEVDPQAAAAAAISGNLPGADYQVPAMPDPAFSTAPSGAGYVVSRDRKGQPTVKFEEKGTVIQNIQPGQRQVSAAEAAMGGQLPTLAKEGVATMATAREQVVKAEDILRLAQDPEVITGFGAEPQLWLARAGAKAGFTGPDAAAKT